MILVMVGKTLKGINVSVQETQTEEGLNAPSGGSGGESPVSP